MNGYHPYKDGSRPGSQNQNNRPPLNNRGVGSNGGQRNNASQVPAGSQPPSAQNANNQPTSGVNNSALISGTNTGYPTLFQTTSAGGNQPAVIASASTANAPQTGSSTTPFAFPTIANTPLAFNTSSPTSSQTPPGTNISRTPQTTSLFSGAPLFGSTTPPTSSVMASNGTSSTPQLSGTWKTSVRRPMKANDGTKGANFTELWVKELEYWAVYQTITCDNRYVNFSHEELRVIDYDQGNKPNTTTSVNPFGRKLVTKSQLLKGPGIEIVVGPESSGFFGALSPVTWCLPKALISHYSPFLKAACSNNFKENEENRIRLPKDDAMIFTLFVEWMYFGAYELSGLASWNENYYDDAKAWVLGDKLMCPGFRNYAMSRIYKRHAEEKSTRVSVTSAAVAYACANTMTGSMLRRFYFEFLATFFADGKRVVGRMEDWDKVLLEHDDARGHLLRGFRHDAGRRKAMRPLEKYLENDESPSAGVAKSGSTGS